MDYINRRICYLAESLLVKGEFLSWRRFSLFPLSNAFAKRLVEKRATKAVADIEIAPVCNKQTDRIVVEGAGDL